MPAHPADDMPDPQMMRVYARMTGPQRLAVVDRLVEGARELCMAGIRAAHPEWGEREVRQELARRVIQSRDREHQ